MYINLTYSRPPHPPSVLASLYAGSGNGKPCHLAEAEGIAVIIF